MKPVKALFAVAFLLLNIESIAQFTLSGEFRPRTEYRHGFKALANTDQDYALFTDQRTRLIAEFKTEGFQTKLSVQDIRTWGAVPQLATTDGMTSIHEAWAEAFMGEGFSFKFGRQEIILDDHRIFGNVDWAQQARSHDAGIFKYNDSTFFAQLGFAFNNDAPQLITRRYTVGSSYKALQYLWLHKNFNKELGLSLLFLNNGKQASQIDTAGNFIVNEYKTFYTQTAGGRVTYKKGKIAGNANIYSQTGNNGAGILNDYAETKVSALLLGADVSYNLTDAVTVTVGGEYQSGNSQVTPDLQQKAFTPFYGTNHKFNGLMDYFYVGNHIGSVGLQDIFMGLNYKAPKFTTGANLHLFSAAADVVDPVTRDAMPGYLGTELDLTFGTNLAKGVALKAGYSQMFGTETLVAIRGGSTEAVSNWAWLMLVVKPAFLTVDGNE